MTKRLIDYQIFSILLHDEAGRRLSPSRHREVRPARAGEIRPCPQHEGIVGAAAKLRRPIVVPDVSLDPRYRMLNPETRSELAVPMIYKTRVIGVMDLESPQLNYFTPDHVQVLSILAAHLAVSIENARLYEQVARDESRMERDLNAARRIQGALLPRMPGPEFGLDIAARVVSSRELSGDLYDFLRYGPHDLGHRARRRKREGKRRRALRRRRRRHPAQPGLAASRAPPTCCAPSMAFSASV